VSAPPRVDPRHAVGCYAGLVPYRTTHCAPPRELVVRNQPLVTAVLATVTGVLFAVVGFFLMPVTDVFVPPPGAGVVMSAVGTVLVLAGVTFAALGLRMRRSRTLLALVRDELTVTVRAGDVPLRHHVIALEDIERVSVEIDDRVTYRAQIVLRGGEVIAIGDATTSARGHYEQVASDIRGFLVGDARRA
jgi:hypothetical protein